MTTHHADDATLTYIAKLEAENKILSAQVEALTMEHVEYVEEKDKLNERLVQLTIELAASKQHIRTDNSAVISALQEELAREKKRLESELSTSERVRMALGKEALRMETERDRYKGLYATAQNELARIKDAARAVVERWHTPLWKDVPATAEYINALAKAIGEMK